MRCGAILATAAACLSALASAAAEPYPSRPITFVVPYAAGGPIDVLARLLGEYLRKPLGQPVIVENISGAGGILGMARVAQAAPDGYSVSIGNWGSHVAAPALFPANFDVLADFAPVTMLTESPVWLVGRASIPASDLRELIAWLKANPDKATAATIGKGTATHLCGIDFQNHTGVRFGFATYRGAAPAIQDIVAGQVDLMFGEISTALPHVRAGTLRAYALLAPRRWFAVPEVPTIDEAGVPGLHIAFWFGMWLPKGTPPEIVTTLERATRAVLADSTLRERIRSQGQAVVAEDVLGPAALAAEQRTAIEKWWPVIKAAKITTE